MRAARIISTTRSQIKRRHRTTWKSRTTISTLNFWSPLKSIIRQHCTVCITKTLKKLWVTLASRTRRKYKWSRKPNQVRKPVAWPAWPVCKARMIRALCFKIGSPQFCLVILHLHLWTKKQLKYRSWIRARWLIQSEARCKTLMISLEALKTLQVCINSRFRAWTAKSFKTGTNWKTVGLTPWISMCRDPRPKCKFAVTFGRTQVNSCAVNRLK